MLGTNQKTKGRLRRGFHVVGIQVAIVVLTLVAIELLLRAIDLRYLRLDQTERSLLYAYDQELGWFPLTNSSSTFTGNRTVSVQHNSFGLRDVEPDRTPKPTIVFVGDSFTWGYDVEAGERFTDIIRRELPDYRIVNAGVSGYGTDQEYLLLRRLWDRISPDVVVLVRFANDSDDNSTNVRYDGAYKPYFQLSGQGGEFRGQPVPKSRHYYSRNNWIARNLLLARLAVAAYVPIRHPVVTVSDPSEHLIGMMQDLVEARGARLLVGTFSEPRIERYLQAQGIPFAVLNSPPDGDDLYYIRNGQRGHWNPHGHANAAGILKRLLAQAGIPAHPSIAGSTVRGPDSEQRN